MTLKNVINKVGPFCDIWTHMNQNWTNDFFTDGLSQKMTLLYLDRYVHEQA